MRKIIYGAMGGMLCLTALTGYLHEPHVITFDDKVEALALVLDGEMLKNPHKVVNAPIPQRKPEMGYTVAFRESMTEFIGGFVE